MNEELKIPFARVDCSGNEAKYTSEVLSSGWLTTASKAKLLEENVRDFIGCKHAMAVNSCTSGLHLALDALGVKQGDKVFVPSFTFTSSAEVIRYMGADPVVLDVDYETAGLSPKILEAAIAKHPDVKVLIGVHFGGLAMNMSGIDGILAICKSADIKIVEDAAHAFPALHNGQYVGTFGDVTCFSFYANKTMTTGEGGMVTTNNDEIAARIKLMRLHGIDRDVWDRFTSKKVTWEYDVIAPGFKYNMPDLNAAVGLAQFERLEQMHEARVSCATRYFSQLSDVVGIELPYVPEVISDHSWHLFPIRVLPESGTDRNSLIRTLNERGIGTSVHYKPIHQLKYYRERYDLSPENFPSSESIWVSTLSLPIYNLLTEAQLDYVCDSIREAIRKAA